MKERGKKIVKKYVGICMVPALLVLVLAAVGCGGGTKEGELPVLKRGDSFVSTITSGGSIYTISAEVTGEANVNGKNCYVIEGTFNPALEGVIDVMIMKVDKATMFPLAVSAGFEYQDVTYAIESKYSYKLSGDSPFPYKVGNEYTVVETETTDTTINGQKDTESLENTYIYKIEKIEDVTVTAGTFKSFKIVKYDETGTTALETRWDSDATRQYTVKGIDHSTGETETLTSFSLK